MAEIDLGAIHEGDIVKLRHDDNLIDVTAHNEAGTLLYALAYGTRIYFAKRVRSGWQHCSGVRVVGHQPQLFDS